jgi:hypothetical protein
MVVTLKRVVFCPSKWGSRWQACDEMPAKHVAVVLTFSGGAAFPRCSALEKAAVAGLPAKLCQIQRHGSCFVCAPPGSKNSDSELRHPAPRMSQARPPRAQEGRNRRKASACVVRNSGCRIEFLVKLDALVRFCHTKLESLESWHLGPKRWARFFLVVGLGMTLRTELLAVILCMVGCGGESNADEGSAPDASANPHDSGYSGLDEASIDCLRSPEQSKSCGCTAFGCTRTTGNGVSCNYYPGYPVEMFCGNNSHPTDATVNCVPTSTTTGALCGSDFGMIRCCAVP